MPGPGGDRSARDSASRAHNTVPAMRILIFHGYLLRGTGSNVYNASLAQALAGQGHEVHLLCQDRHAAELDWVDSVGDWDGGSLQVKRIRDAGHAGSVA